MTVQELQVLLTFLLIKYYFVRFFQIVFIVMKYREYESNVTIKIQAGNQPFPSITICNENPIRLSQIPNTNLEGFVGTRGPSQYYSDGNETDFANTTTPTGMQ